MDKVKKTQTFGEYIQQLIEPKITVKKFTKILEWAGTEKFKYDGVKLWKRSYDGSGYWPIKDRPQEYYNTNQLIEQYFKENG